MMNNKILNKIFNEEINDIHFNSRDPQYLQLLCDLGILDDMECWDLYCKMVDKEFEILKDDSVDKYFK